MTSSEERKKKNKRPRVSIGYDDDDISHSQRERVATKTSNSSDFVEHAVLELSSCALIPTDGDNAAIATRMLAKGTKIRLPNPNNDHSSQIATLSHTILEVSLSPFPLSVIDLSKGQSMTIFKKMTSSFLCFPHLTTIFISATSTT